MPEIKHPNRGEVYLVEFDPARGAEINKTRPAVVIQNDVSNEFSAITIVAAVSSTVPDRLRKNQAFIRAGEGGLHHDSVAVLNQLRSVDRQRLVRRIGRVELETMREIDIALIHSLDLLGSFE